jgi:hypothetical protein
METETAAFGYPSRALMEQSDVSALAISDTRLRSRRAAVSPDKLCSTTEVRSTQSSPGDFKIVKTVWLQWELF